MGKSKNLIMKIYFLTYGNKAFHYSKIHLCSLAKESGFYDGIISLKPSDLDKNFRLKFENILKEGRGSGYWIWKHEIINELLKKINKNDVILYCDAGSSINNGAKAKERFSDYLNIIHDRDVDFLRFETEKQFMENQYTSKELFKATNIQGTSKIANTTQLQAGVMFYKKNDTNLEFFQEYKSILYNDPNLITDYYQKNQKNTFIENRHDQSIFSILGKKYNSYTLDNETEFRERKHLQYDFPILTVRAYNHGLRDKLKLSLFKPIYGKKTIFFT
tara:strand:- start:315 stop:1139 length:825 start_codon:yes stop_codon:yes gene_type:complete